MTKFLLRLFEAPEVSFRQIIDEYEAKSGRQSLDIRLTDSIRHESQVIHDFLSLHDQPTEKELYYSLQNLARAENDLIEKMLDIDDRTTPADIVKKVLNYLEKRLDVHQSYFIKPTIFKNYYKKHPPKKTMKLLGYRSVDSMLKRESLPLVASLVKGQESVEWNRSYDHFLGNFLASDGAAHDVSIKQIEPKAHNHLISGKIKLSYFIRESLELGQAVVVPMSKRFQNDTLSYVVAVVDAIRKMQLYGSYYNYLRFQPDFGKRLQLVVQNGIHKGTEDYFSMMWPAYFKYISDHTDDEFINQPIINVPDVMAKHFMLKAPWHKLETVAYGQDNPVSLNLIDVVTNTSNNIPFEQRFLHNAQQAIWDRLNIEYMKHRQDVEL